jgi:hypothetical protein
MTKKAKAGATAMAAFATGMLFLSTTTYAQESANAELNSCVKKEQVLATAKGAGIGALTGLSAMLVTHKKDDAVKGALIGAAVGGVAGFLTAYYTAINTCYKQNPSWIPESQIQRTESYEAVKKEINYKPAQGVIAQADAVAIDGPVKPDGQAVVNSTFIVMTPDGAEAPVTIERKLYVVGSDGKEALVDFPGHASEQHTFEPGQQQDTVHIPIPHDAKPGSAYRVEFSVAADNKPASTSTQKFIISQ